MSEKCRNCGRESPPEEMGDPCPSCGGVDRMIDVTEQVVFSESVSRDVAARDLATRHHQIEDGLTRVIRYVRKDEAEIAGAEPIKLLEVNEHTIPSGIMPLYFGAAPGSGVPYPTVIVEVTPEEFEKIQRRELRLPEGWEIGEELPKPSDGVGAK